MSSPTHAIASIITSNYFDAALTLYSYIKESNSEVDHLVLIIGEEIISPQDLPTGPKWIYWHTIYDNNKRMHLASEYTPFELSCAVRGRFHHHIGTELHYDKWIMMDTDIGVLADLTPIWQALDSSSVVLTPHTTKPVCLEQAIPHEANILRSGLFNGGVVGMKRSETATQASQWLCERLESYGHAYAHRRGSKLSSCYEFEFVDQIWLNLLYLYVGSDALVVGKAYWNLGHWNLHQGKLEIREGTAYFNKEKVLVAHFSGLPAEEDLAKVSIHSELYRNNPSDAWAVLANEYISRRKRSKEISPSLAYSYSAIQPGSSKSKDEDTRSGLVSSTSKRHYLYVKISRIARGLLSPKKVLGMKNLIAWKIQRTFQALHTIWLNKD